LTKELKTMQLEYGSSSVELSTVLRSCPTLTSLSTPVREDDINTFNVNIPNPLMQCINLRHLYCTATSSLSAVPLCFPSLTTLLVCFEQHFDFAGIETLVHLNKFVIIQQVGGVRGGGDAVPCANAGALASCRALS
jgi:hypothetical protein